MIALMILGIGLFGLACNYFGWKQGLKDGLKISKEEYTKLFDREIDLQVDKTLKDMLTRIRKDGADS